MAALRVKSFEKLLKFSSTFLLSPKWLKDVIFIKWNLNCVAPSYVTCAIYVITWPLERCSKRPSIGVQFEWFIFKKFVSERTGARFGVQTQQLGTTTFVAFAQLLHLHLRLCKWAAIAKNHSKLFNAFSNVSTNQRIFYDFFSLKNSILNPQMMYLRIYPRQNGSNVYIHVGLTKVQNV